MCLMALPGFESVISAMITKRRLALNFSSSILDFVQEIQATEHASEA
jgi:hypothetical protein